MIGGINEDTYLGYMTKMTRQANVGVSIGLCYNEMAIEYFLEIESSSDKIESCN
jgi:hypothetical protein